MDKPWMVYGANGYTGELIAREAARRGLKPILAGRSPGKIAPLANDARLGSTRLRSWRCCPDGRGAGGREPGSALRRSVLGHQRPDDRRVPASACALPRHYRRDQRVRACDGAGCDGARGRHRRVSWGRVRRHSHRLPGGHPQGCAARRHAPRAGLRLPLGVLARHGQDVGGRLGPRRQDPQGWRDRCRAARLQDAPHRFRRRREARHDHPLGRRVHRLPYDRHTQYRGLHPRLARHGRPRPPRQLFPVAVGAGRSSELPEAPDRQDGEGARARNARRPANLCVGRGHQWARPDRRPPGSRPQTATI